MELTKLILGCGHFKKSLFYSKESIDTFTVVTLDINPTLEPDIVWDLNYRPLPFPTDSFDVIEACDVLEHIGKQGDYKSFFEEFHEYWRILKPNGCICGICPAPDSIWAWGDPGHTRIINDGTIVFLSHEKYDEQSKVGTPMSDYKYLLGETNFHIDNSYYTDNKQFIFVLRAIK